MYLIWIRLVVPNVRVAGVEYIVCSEDGEDAASSIQTAPVVPYIPPPCPLPTLASTVPVLERISQNCRGPPTAADMFISYVSVNGDDTLERRTDPYEVSPLLKPEGLNVLSNTDEAFVDVHPLACKVDKL